MNKQQAVQELVRQVLNSRAEVAETSYSKQWRRTTIESAYIEEPDEYGEISVTFYDVDGMDMLYLYTGHHLYPETILDWFKTILDWFNNNITMYKLTTVPFSLDTEVE